MGYPSAEDTAAEYLVHLERLSEQLLTAADPYEVALRIWGDSMGAVSESCVLAHPMWLLWGALTDWVECKPEETELAKTQMVRAAQAWLALDRTDSATVDRYFDYWLYEVCGYERP